MFSIGEFARLGSVSVRTLRHYDEIGLLHPAKVGPGTGYRSYAADQFGQLNRIMALKGLGFSLEQTHKLISGPEHAVPVVNRASSDRAWFPHWSGDGQSRS